ncbi:pseudo histidine-containing phosphotransfer protein 5-like [Aristolochia californica]|uniref:pseudo histidine-containing phosphotransfer protein 5-like n=1 Tax=Aristolochia californica TaxID=171875 RepID=UPI0035DD2544
MENPLHRQVANLRKALFDQGFIDEQFIQLEELQDDVNPNFVEEVVTLFYKASVRTMLNIEAELEQRPLDFTKLDSCMHTFKGSCSSIGARRLKSECSRFRDFCQERNSEGCFKTYQLVKKEHDTLRKKLETYFQMSRQAGPIEAACRPK